MKALAMFLALIALLLTSTLAAADEYHVYKLSNGECEIDTRDHDKFKSARGSNDCKGHFSHRTDAEKLRKKLVKEGKCKCPTGQNC